MRFICFMCPTIIILYIVKNKNADNTFLSQLKLYLVSLPIVNAIASLMFHMFSSSSYSVWDRVEGNEMLFIKYVIVSFVVAILVGLLLECARLKLSFRITTIDKQVKNDAKESKKESEKENSR